jgi:hypothetical protein
MHGGLSILAVLLGLLIVAWLFAGERARGSVDTNKG